MPARPERRLEYDRARAASPARRAWFRSWMPRGTHPSGRWTPSLSDRQVRAIRQLVLEQGETVADVARSFGLSYGYTWQLVRGKRRLPGMAGTAGTRARVSSRLAACAAMVPTRSLPPFS